MMTSLLVVGVLFLAVSVSNAIPEADTVIKCQNDPSCYWWMDDSSAFNQEKLKGAQYNNLVTFNNGVNPKNPFFNGQFEKLPQSATFNNGSEKPNINNNPFFVKDPNTNFPTAHPAGLVNNEQNKPNYSKNPFLQNMFTANGSQISRNEGFLGVQPKPFSETHPLQGQLGENDDFTLTPSSYSRKCPGEDFICVPISQCQNGVLPDYISNSLQEIKKADQLCDLRANACCKISNQSKSQEVKVIIPNFDVRSNFSSGFVTAGKSSIPESLIKFGGVAGFSPGLIHVLPVEVNNAGESGNAHSGGSTQKPVRDLSSGINQRVFESTPDYSNYNFEDVRFASSIQGPAYLPPINNPPISSTTTLNLEYIPASKPTLPPLPKPSVGPYEPQPSQQFSSLRPFTTSYISTTPKPIENNEYLPPVIPQITNNINDQYKPFPSTPKPYTTPAILRPSFTTTFRPTNNFQYLPPRTPSSVHSYQISPSNISPFVAPKNKPQQDLSYLPPIQKTEPTTKFTTEFVFSSTTPRYTYVEKSTPGYTYSQPTQGYHYQTPTPAFNYPTVPKVLSTTTQKILIPSPSIKVENEYRPSTNGYDYPKPSPSSISTQKTSPSKPTAGYEYPKPTPAFELPSASSNNSPTRTSYPNTPRTYPTSTTSRPTPGYTYPKPTPGYTYPKPTPGYSYPKPTPTFEYPDKIGAPGSNNNQYIPPPQPNNEQEGSDTSDTSVNVRPKPEVQPDQSSRRETAVLPSACAAALKCVQNIYCSADGVISPVPVVLTNEQLLKKVPTTMCRDVSSGIIGVCCRDPNYKDPWPSANLVNGFDDGQYKEDNSIGQYKQQQLLNDINFARPSRSNIRRFIPNNSVKQIENTNFLNQEEKCGVRNQNTSPKGPGPLNTNFAEIPWQAMILRETNRSLLCGGAIIKRNAILTNAHCIEGLATEEILVKGGEWKLGIDEEPLPFQIIKVTHVVRHPGYKAGSFIDDLAILFLEEKFRLAKNVGTICLPEPNKIPTRNCIATGWGKRILQLHAKGAVMRSINVNIMDNEQCRKNLEEAYSSLSSNYSPNTLCGFSDNDQCKVDYGSALACTNEAGNYVLSGIFTWDTGCKDEKQIGGYVAPDVQWIKDSLSSPQKIERN